MFATAIDTLLSLSPAPTGSQTIDRWSFEMLKVPSFFLYAAKPLIDGAIVNLNSTVPPASEPAEMCPTASFGRTEQFLARGNTTQQLASIHRFAENLVLRYREFNVTTDWRLLLKDSVNGEMIQVKEPLIQIMLERGVLT